MNTNNKFIMNRYYFLILKITIFILFDMRKVHSYDIKNESKYYFCRERIFISDQRISVNEINQLCDKILNDYRMLILIQNDLQLVSMTGNIDNYYIRDSEEFFNRQCNRLNRSICEYGFMISIYTSARKVQITAGRISKNTVTIEMRNNIIYNIKSILSREKYTDAIYRAIDMLQSYSAQNVNPYVPPGNPYPQPTYVTPPPQKQSSSTGFWIFFLIVVCPCICICVYCMLKRQQEENQYQNQHHSNPNPSADDIHQHLNKLDNLIQEIRRNSPPVVSIKMCLLCMQKIQMASLLNPNNFSTTSNDYYNNNYNTNLLANDPHHTRFSCGHLYHVACLNHHRLFSCCFMCVVNNTITIPNTHDSQVVDESNIKNFISKLHLIYDKNSLEEYSRTYPNEFNSYNNSLALGLVGVWGITAIAGTAIMMSDMHHYNDMNHYSHGYGYQNDYNAYNSGYYNQNNNYSSYNDNIGSNTAEGDY